MKTLGIVVIGGIGVFAVAALGTSDEPLRELPSRDDSASALTEVERGRLEKRRALGRELFWSPLLSNNATAQKGLTSLSCASCHDPARGGAIGGKGTDVTGKQTAYDVPSVFNAAYNARQAWGGFETSLEDVAYRAMKNLMGSARIGASDELMQNLVSEVSADGTSYRDRFALAYADTPLAPNKDGAVARAALLDALAEYMRAITPRDSPFDVWMRSERAPGAMLEGSQMREGYELFKKFGCSSCHQGVNVGGNMLARFGVLKETDSLEEQRRNEAAAKVEQEAKRQAALKRGDDGAPDGGSAPSPAGRQAQNSPVREGTGLSRDTKSSPMFEGGDDGIYKVPSLRNVALTAPYFHDGRTSDLKKAVEIMAWKQLARTLTDAEANAIVAFLNSLTGTVPDDAYAPGKVGR